MLLSLSESGGAERVLKRIVSQRTKYSTSIWCREAWGFVIKHLPEEALKGHLFKSLSKANMPGGAGILLMFISASWFPLLPSVADYCPVFSYSDLEHLNLKYITSYKVGSSVNRKENLFSYLGAELKQAKITLFPHGDRLKYGPQP